MTTSAAPSFRVTALWDSEAGVFHSESDIPGLVVEAETFDAFVDLVRGLAPEVLADNRPDVAPPYRITVEVRRDLVLAAA